MDEKCDGPIDISYNFQFTNGYKFSDKHFSADEIGVMETMITFVCLQTLLIGYFLYVRKLLKSIHKNHHTVKMLGASIFLAWFAHGWILIHYIWFAYDGLGWVGFIYVGRLFQGASETVFLLLLILVGKGWTICCRKISARGRVKIAVFGTVYSITWLAIPTYYYLYGDRASTLHFYQSAYGYILLTLRLFGLGWFLSLLGLLGLTAGPPRGPLRPPEATRSSLSPIPLGPSRRLLRPRGPPQALRSQAGSPRSARPAHPL